MTYLDFMRANQRWLAGGFMLTLGSSFGQTYFISLFGGDIRSEFNLSHGDFGGLYAIATVASAFVLIWFGKLADHMRIVPLSLIGLGGLAIACVAMGSVSSATMLGFAFFGLRLFGQGFLTHVSLTAMGRWFSAQRGRAVSLASLGFPVGESFAPLVAVALAASIGWRQTWFFSALLLIVVFVPTLWALFSVRRVKSGTSPQDVPGDRPLRVTRDWTRKEMLGDYLFYALLPGLVAPAFIITGIFFHQVYLVEVKGWSLGVFAAGYPLFAGFSVITGLWAGIVIDKRGAVSLLPTYLLLLAAGLVVLALFDEAWASYVFMALAGLSVGISATILGAIWAELYGTAHLGAIRAIGTSLMVFSSALAPGFMGWLIDVGVALETQFIWMAVYIAVISAISVILCKKTRLRNLILPKAN